MVKKQIHITNILDTKTIEELSNLFLILPDDKQTLVVKCILDSYIKGRESIGIDYLTNNN